jgi:hypothetical protein
MNNRGVPNHIMSLTELQMFHFNMPQLLIVFKRCVTRALGTLFDEALPVFGISREDKCDQCTDLTVGPSLGVEQGGTG